MLRHASLAELQAQARVDPSDLEVQFYLGRRARSAGQMQTALAAFAHAAEFDVSNERAWVEWAQTTASSGKPDVAVGILKTFLLKNPGSAQAQVAISNLYLQNDTPLLALQAAQEATRIDPRSAESWLYVGKAYEALKEDQLVEAPLKKAITLAPGDWHGYQELGEFYFSQKEYPLAIASYRRAIKLAPAEGAPYLGLGKTLVRIGAYGPQLDEARQDLEKASRLDTLLPAADRSDLYLTLGQVYEEQSDWERAKSWLLQSEALVPGNLTTHYELEHVYTVLGDTPDATRERKIHEQIYEAGLVVVHLNDRVHSAPQDLQARMELAQVYASYGDYANAIAQYQTVLQKDAHNKTAQSELKKLQSMRNQGHAGSFIIY
ncbi:MAG TPA: tetratricopeptide repeat protein [Capsulimonadaceae bacterium]|nr:tetratricopeptide repeat protein [Capsulimonadaceae bacterium]